MKTLIPQFLIFLIMICSCTSHTNKELKKFTLRGNIDGQDTGMIVLIYFPDTIRIIDTVKIQNGQFKFTGKIYDPLIADLDGGNDLNRLTLYLEPKKMKITLSKDRFSKYNMTGSRTQSDYENLKETQNPFFEKIAELRSLQTEINDSIKTTESDAIKGR